VVVPRESSCCCVDVEGPELFFWQEGRTKYNAEKTSVRGNKFLIIGV
jgi:hypothetical protein